MVALVFSVKVYKGASSNGHTYIYVRFHQLSRLISVFREVEDLSYDKWMLERALKKDMTNRSCIASPGVRIN